MQIIVDKRFERKCCSSQFRILGENVDGSVECSRRFYSRMNPYNKRNLVTGLRRVFSNIAFDFDISDMHHCGSFVKLMLEEYCPQTDAWSLVCDFRFAA